MNPAWAFPDFAATGVLYQVQWASKDLGLKTVWNDLDSQIVGDDSTITMFDPLAAPDGIAEEKAIHRMKSRHCILFDLFINTSLNPAL